MQRGKRSAEVAAITRIPSVASTAARARQGAVTTSRRPSRRGSSAISSARWPTASITTVAPAARWKVRIERRPNAAVVRRNRPEVTTCTRISESPTKPSASANATTGSAPASAAPPIAVRGAATVTASPESSTGRASRPATTPVTCRGPPRVAPGDRARPRHATSPRRCGSPRRPTACPVHLEAPRARGTGRGRPRPLPRPGRRRFPRGGPALGGGGPSQGRIVGAGPKRGMRSAEGMAKTRPA